MYNINDMIGQKFHVGNISTFSLTVSSGIEAIPTKIGRRDYIKIINSGAIAVQLFSSPILSDTEGFTVTASGGAFEDSVSSPLYIKSTGADTIVNIYERKDARKPYNKF